MQANQKTNKVMQLDYTKSIFELDSSNAKSSIFKSDSSNAKSSIFGSQKNCRYGICFGTTARGYSCNNCAKMGSSYCGTHSKKKLFDDGYRYNTTCTAISRSTGRQCRNKAKNGMYCSKHSY